MSSFIISSPLSITDENLIPIALPIHTICNYICAILLLIIIISTIKHFRKDNQIAKSIKITVLSCFIISFLCLLIRIITWSPFFNIQHCNYIKYFFPVLYLLQKTFYYEFLVSRLRVTFKNSFVIESKDLFNEKIWCLKAYNYTQWIFFTLWVIISTDVPYKSKIKYWGLWCEEYYKKSFIVPYVALDAVYSFVVLSFYISGLRKIVVGLENSNDRKKHGKKLQSNLVEIAKAQTILCSIAVCTTIILIGVANVLVKPLSWFSNFDLLINCLCVFLMFNFVNMVERIKIVGICCWCWCCCGIEKYIYDQQKLKELQILDKSSLKMRRLSSQSPKSKSTTVTDSPNNLSKSVTPKTNTNTSSNDDEIKRTNTVSRIELTNTESISGTQSQVTTTMDSVTELDKIQNEIKNKKKQNKIKNKQIRISIKNIRNSQLIEVPDMENDNE